MNIHIMPIKQFLQMDTTPYTSVAVISSSAYVDQTQIPCPYILQEYMDFDYASSRSLSTEQALAFANFLKNTDKGITDIYVCCDAGESRSPAIAAAIHRWFAQSDRHVWESAIYHPNVLCFCRMMEALNLSITDEEIDVLIQTNRYAFKMAMQKAKQETT